MSARHPAIPRYWLMTDERIGDALWDAIARLPRGGGIVFRHHGLRDAERRPLFAKVSRAARRRGLLLVAAGRRLPGPQPRHRRGGPALTAPVHARAEAVAAARNGARALFVSPVFATRSHADARPLGAVRLGLMIRGLRTPVIALGGMNPDTARRLSGLRIHGWAAIDAWLPDQKRNAVPT